MFGDMCLAQPPYHRCEAGGDPGRGTLAPVLFRGCNGNAHGIDCQAHVLASLGATSASASHGNWKSPPDPAVAESNSLDLTAWIFRSEIQKQSALSINVSWLALRVAARVSAPRILLDVLPRTRAHIGWRSTACLPASPADTGVHRRYRAGRPARRKPGTRPANHRRFDIRASRSRLFPEIRQITRTPCANS